MHVHSASPPCRSIAGIRSNQQCRRARCKDSSAFFSSSCQWPRRSSTPFTLYAMGTGSTSLG
jgi:hypothetical protein